MSIKLARGGAQSGFCASFAQAVIDHVAVQGGDVSQVKEAMGCQVLSPRDTAAYRIPAARLFAGLERAARILGDEHVGLQVGARHLPSTLSYAAMTAPHGLAAMRLYTELHLLCTGELTLCHEARGPLMEVFSQEDATARLPCSYAFWSMILAADLHFIRAACGRNVVPERVALPCPAPHDDGALRHFVGTAVQFHAGRYSVWHAMGALKLPNPNSRPEIHGVMATMARREWRELFDADEILISRLRQAMLHALERGESPTLASLAERLSCEGEISVRQLQRKLTAQRTSFRDLLSDVRRERALAQLSSTDRPLADIAAEAGYAEMSSFHRAVRRWTGSTPMRIRKEGEGCLEC